ncbi:hypothetical protein [Pseudomonas sp. OIL-1]|nr:hypothetical protein [Pseudomonas sp. OIL-1]QIB50430.1 hypothetical protein G3M63_04705 [Pseudomonas sp. OIL-1]
MTPTPGVAQAHYTPRQVRLGLLPPGVVERRLDDSLQLAPNSVLDADL